VSETSFAEVTKRGDAMRYSLTMSIDKDESKKPPIVFRLDDKSGVPTYLQIVQQVERDLRLGYLVKGDQLPRVKDVVGTLSINPNTVLKAYSVLEQKGIILGRPGLGTFIEAAPETIGLSDLNALRRKLVTGWLKEATSLGLDEDAVVSLFLTAIRDVWDTAPKQDSPAKDELQCGEGVA
jgi:GntR family transcriptional regulator